MKSVVDRGLAFGFLVPVVDGLNQRFAVILNGEVDDGCCATVSRSDRAGAEVIGSERAAEWEFHVSMRVDAPGNDKLAGSIDRAVGFHCELRADDCDLIAFN